MKRWLISLICLLAAVSVWSQYIPAVKPEKPVDKNAHEQYWHKKNFMKHMEVSLTLGTTGVGIDIAAPLCEYVQVRAGYDYMLPLRKTFNIDVLGDGQAPRQYDEQGNRIESPFDRIAEEMYQQTGYELENRVSLKGKLTMGNAKFLIDVYPFKYDKSWHITAGLYWGPSQFAKIDNASGTEDLLQHVRTNDRLALSMGKYSREIYQNGKSAHHKGDAYLMKPADDNTVHIEMRSNAFKPYLGFGYGGRLFPDRGDWKVTVECGVLFWGGTPSQTVHDGINLSKDVEDISGTIGTYVSVIEALKVYPVLSVRFAKTLF